MKKTEVTILDGDIAQVPADALITAINSRGSWFGGIDQVIMRTAGNFFHQIALANMPLKNGQTVTAKGSGHVHKGAFRNVIFVVDDLQDPLRNIIYNGLKAAYNAGFKNITLPTIRMGVMLGAVEKTTRQAVDEMAAGVQAFLEKTPDGLDSITFVVYNDLSLQRELEDALSR